MAYRPAAYLATSSASFPMPLGMFPNKMLLHEWDVGLGTRTLQHDVLGQTRPAVAQFLIRPNKADHRPGQFHLVRGPFGRFALRQSPMRGLLAPHLRRPPRAGLERAVEGHRLDGIALDAGQVVDVGDELPDRLTIS